MTTSATATLDLTKPIDEKLLNRRSRYLEFKGTGYYTRADAIVKAIRNILWDQCYAGEFHELLNRAKTATGDERDELYAESDIVDDKCYLQAIAIARKNGLIGPSFKFGLWQPYECEDRFGIELPQVKRSLGLRKMRQEDVDKLYENAVQAIRNKH